MIKGKNKKQETWKIGIIQGAYQVKDQVIQTVRIKSSRGSLERPIQMLCPLELSCDNDSNINNSNNNQPRSIWHCNIKWSFDMKDQKLRIKTLKNKVVLLNIVEIPNMCFSWSEKHFAKVLLWIRLFIFV